MKIKDLNGIVARYFRLASNKHSLLLVQPRPYGSPVYPGGHSQYCR